MMRDMLFTETVLRTEELTKVYEGTTVVNKVCLEVKNGEVLGLLGPNGAGKTTIINMILGLTRPTRGSVEILGRAVKHGEAIARRYVGAVIDGVAFYRHLCAEDNLMALGNVRGVPGGAPWNPETGRALKDRIFEVLELVGLAGKARAPVATYSYGMLRRLALAVALIRDPKILILDEPTTGLDPEGILELRNLVRYLARGGKSILLSSHLLHEVQLTCDRVAILKKGEVIAQGEVQALIGRAPGVDLENVFFEILKEA
ncbi:MAG TPA: ABC transporter ATP-binding protein [Firmicutes bacterium]|nr:ABC transporter ATP-binding protein [Bacillota bacterium]